MKERLLKILRMMIGFAIIGCGTMISKQGACLNSWNVLNDGLSKTIGITIGQANTMIGIFIILIDILAKEKLGIGTVLNATCIGMFSDLFINLNNSLGLLPKAGSVWMQIPYCLLGIVCSSFGIYLYMSAQMGSGPRDSLTLAITRRVPYQVGVCRMALEACAFVAGVLLGGEFGVGTFIAVFCGGPCMQQICKLMHYDVKKTRNESFGETWAFLRQWAAERRQKA